MKITEFVGTADMQAITSSAFYTANVNNRQLRCPICSPSDCHVQAYMAMLDVPN